MDIEGRAEKWAREYARDHGTFTPDFGEDDLMAAYLAGSAQTQADYTAPRPTGTPCNHGPSCTFHNP